MKKIPSDKVELFTQMLYNSREIKGLFTGTLGFITPPVAAAVAPPDSQPLIRLSCAVAASVSVFVVFVVAVVVFMLLLLLLLLLFLLFG